MDAKTTDHTFRTPFEALGGEAGVRALVDAFYDAMETDVEAGAVRAMHAPDLSPMRERLADWLTGWMGGPPVYAERHPGRPCVVSAHKPYRIGEAEVAQWMACMHKALAGADIPQMWRGLLKQAFEQMCQGLRNA